MKPAIAIAAVSLAFTSVGFGQGEDEAAAPAVVEAFELAKVLDEPIDEIIVHGEMTTLQLRNEVYRAENKLFGMYNQLNDDDQYDIKCKNEARIGSNFKRRVCAANYLSRLRADARARMPFSPYRQPIVSDVAVEEKRQILADKLKALLINNPDFRKLSEEYADAQKAYDEVVEQ